MPAKRAAAEPVVTAAAASSPPIAPPPVAPDSTYLVPFAVLKDGIKLVTISGKMKVDLTYDELLALFRQLLEATAVDEAWYRATYPDVGEAIAAGTYRDAKDHFVRHGYFEGRRPFAMAVDSEWYLETYPDIKESIEQGLFESAQQHFARHGYEEGRRPTRA